MSDTAARLLHKFIYIGNLGRLVWIKLYNRKRQTQSMSCMPGKEKRSQ